MRGKGKPHMAMPRGRKDCGPGLGSVLGEEFIFLDHNVHIQRTQRPGPKQHPRLPGHLLPRIPATEGAGAPAPAPQSLSQGPSFTPRSPDPERPKPPGSGGSDCTIPAGVGQLPSRKA